MIFTFPAIVSENVDQRLLAGITKSLEQYYLHHMIVAINTGSIRPYIDVDSTGHAAAIRMESLDYFDALLPSHIVTEDVKDLTFSQLTLPDKEWYKPFLAGEDKGTMQYRVGDKQMIAKRAQAQEILSMARQDAKKAEAAWVAIHKGEKPRGLTDRQHKQLLKRIKDTAKEAKFPKSTDPRAQLAGGKATLNVPPGLGFTPTMASIDATVWIRSSSSIGSKKWQLMDKTLIIGVKIIPTVVKNFSSMYDVLRDDYYANTIRYMFKGASRAILRAVYTNPAVKKFKRWYELVMGRSSPDEIGGSPADWYFSILLSKKALLNASGFAPGASGLAYRQYTSAIAIMNKDEKEDLFDDPSRLQRLFNMGWNSFLITDDHSKAATFCSNLDRGKCIRLPYSFIMSSLNADQIYKSYEDLERASGGFFRKIKGSSLNIKKLAKESYVNNTFERYQNVIGSE